MLELKWNIGCCSARLNINLVWVIDQPLQQHACHVTDTDVGKRNHSITFHSPPEWNCFEKFCSLWWLNISSPYSRRGEGKNTLKNDVTWMHPNSSQGSRGRLIQRLKQLQSSRVGGAAFSKWSQYRKAENNKKHMTHQCQFCPTYKLSHLKRFRYILSA